MEKTTVTDGPRMRVEVAEDRRGATLTLLPPSGLEGTIALNPRQLTELIQALGAVRSALVAGTAAPPLEGSNLNAAIGPRWLITPDARTDGSMLAFQHPAYGAVAAIFPRPEVEKIVRLLSNHLAIVQVPEGARPS